MWFGPGRLPIRIRIISLYPRPVEEIIRRLNLFDNFEKILAISPGVFNKYEICYQYGEARTIALVQTDT